MATQTPDAVDDVEPATAPKPIRLCIGCGQRDDHPRHVIHGQQPWHMDCHVLATDCPLCAQQLAACNTSTANDGVVGAELQARLLALDPTVTTTEEG